MQNKKFKIFLKWTGLGTKKVKKWGEIGGGGKTLEIALARG